MLVRVHARARDTISQLLFGGIDREIIVRAVRVLKIKRKRELLHVAEHAATHHIVPVDDRAGVAVV